MDLSEVSVMQLSIMYVLKQSFDTALVGRQKQGSVKSNDHSQSHHIGSLF